MGNQTALTFDNCCEFEANNCLPITWLALFKPQDFLAEKRNEDGEEYEAALFRTSCDAAKQRVSQVITTLKGRTSAWVFLRPIEMLRDEIEFCSPEGSIELNATQLWAMNDSFQQKIPKAAKAFQEMVSGFNGDSEHDIPLLTQLAREYALGTILSLPEMDQEERMFILIGTYFGNLEREELYSLFFFGENDC